MKITLLPSNTISNCTSLVYNVNFKKSNFSKLSNISNYVFKLSKIVSNNEI